MITKKLDIPIELMPKDCNTMIVMDLEMTGLSLKDKIISIGAVDIMTGKAFYAESIDWGLQDISGDNLEWMTENVIANLVCPENIRHLCFMNELTNDEVTKQCDFIKSTETLVQSNSIKLKDETTTMVVGGLNTIRVGFIEWLLDIMNITTDKAILAMDVGYYDFTMFAEIFGGAMKLPDCIYPIYHEVLYDIASLKNISLDEAFNVSRMSLLPSPLETELNKYPILTRSGHKHNALVDAIMVSMIYNC